MNRKAQARLPDAPPPRSAEPPQVSVVVPCRNERPYIESALASILAQTAPAGGFEVIVVDGESDDGTRAVLERLSAQHPNLRLLDNRRRIAAAGMNAGILASRGEFIMILGAHTEYGPGYLQACLALMREHPEADCVGGPIRSRGQSAFGRAVAAAMSHPLGIGNALHRHPGYEGYAEGACFPMFRRSAFERIGLYDERLVRNQDDEFNFRLARAGGRVYLSARARCEYRVRETPRALWRQYFEYGYWRVAVLRKHGRPAALRHLAPVVFFLSLVALLILGLARGGLFWWLGGAVFGGYLAALVLAGLSAIGRVGVMPGLLFAPASAIMHGAYAAGFLWAAFRGPALWRGKKRAPGVPGA